MKFLLFFAVFISGISRVLATYGKKAEQTILFSVFVFTGIGYVFGIFGFLRAGFYACCIFSVSMWLYAAYRIFTKRNLKETLKNIFTPASLAFTVVMGLYTFSVVGLKASKWDEFSHWAKSVKIMFLTDALCSRPGSGTAFGIYPPAVGIFQYILMNINGEYTEWILYFAYAFIVFAAIFYFASDVPFKRLPQVLVCFFAALLVILTYDGEFLLNLQVDLLVSVMVAFCISHILCFNPAGDIYQNIVLSSAMAFTVLVKDASAYFVLFVCVAYVMFFLSGKKNSVWNLSRREKIFLASPVLSVAAAMLSWKIHISLLGTTSMFDGKYDIAEFIMILFGKQVGYKNQVLENFLRELFNFSESYRNEIQISYGLLLFISLSLLYAIMCFLKNNRKENRSGYSVVFRIVTVCAVLYPVGLLASYMYKFIEYEALNLASFYRYMNIDAVALALICVFAGGRYFITSSKNTQAALLFAAAFAFTLANNKNIRWMISREYVSTVAQKMRWLDTAASNVNSFAGERDNVAVITIGGGDFESFCIGYRMWPAENKGGMPVNITTASESRFDGDSAVKDYSVEDFINSFETNQFDYLLLARIDDAFGREYEQAFADPADIQSGNVFYLNSDTKQFTLMTQ